MPAKNVCLLWALCVLGPWFSVGALQADAQQAVPKAEAKKTESKKAENSKQPAAKQPAAKQPAKKAAPSVPAIGPTGIQRTLPPAGAKIPDADRQALEAARAAVALRIEGVRQGVQGEKAAARLVDVEIYEKAVRFALENDEFFDPKEVANAHKLLETASQRLDEIKAGQAKWTAARGLVVRGYRSKLDDSVQPYGLEIPEKLDLTKPVPLVAWLHGRGDKLSDLNYIQERQSRGGQVKPTWAITLHVYGRYCNAFKSAGETDVFEAIEAVQANYPIDPNRVVLWGFSMGGAGSWHLGAHYADRFCAVSPGAGFADVAKYQRVDPATVPALERTLWNVYDVPPYVRNLFNVPVIAYSGELDKQKQAADLMAEAFKAEGRELKHLIGPGVEHKYEPKTLAELTDALEGLAKAGRQAFPSAVSLQTRTLRYSKQHWVQALALGKHWEDSRVDAELVEPGRLSVKTKNIVAVQLTWPGDNPPAQRTIDIDGQQVSLPADAPPRAVSVLERTSEGWKLNTFFNRGSALRKSPGLQGPIDDAFLEPFLVVLPTGKSAHPKVEEWVQKELLHFRDRWKRLFRGEVQIKRDVDVTIEDMQAKHLILWGDRASNQVIAKTAPYAPLKWDDKGITAAGQTYDPAGHVLLAIFPNPLLQRPNRYVVFNSGPTFRESHDRTNSLQNPKLPDWAVVDLSVPPDGVAPGKVAAAGFFDEEWKP